MNFVRNAWYVAGWASEFDRQLRQVRILSEDLVMFRTSTGGVAALQEIAGLNAISRVIPVTVALQLTPAD